MTEILDMAKAHLQNVAIRIEELKNQEKTLHEEIEKLSNYLNNGLNVIEKQMKSQENN